MSDWRKLAPWPSVRWVVVVTDSLCDAIDRQRARPPVPVSQFAPSGIWERVAGLIDQAPSLDALRAHRLQLLAAWLWRSRGRELPSDLREEDRRAAMTALAASGVLRRVRDAYGGRMMLMKGPEAAACYPEPRTRAYGDIDLLVDDPSGAQRALVAAGFIESDYGRDHARAQHLDPLIHPELGVIVEIHRRPNCPPGLVAPATDELISLSVPSATRIDGLLAPSRASHALLLAAHAWAHHPLGCLGDLIDVAAVLPTDERRAAALLARQWGWERMWRTTLSAADALVAGGPEPLALRTWARHLATVNELSVIENHVIRIVAPCFALPGRQVPRGIATAVRTTAGRHPGERWPTKLGRTLIALRDASTVMSQHDRRVRPKPWHR